MPRIRRTAQRIILILASTLFMSSFAVAQDLTQKRLDFAHKQCANACQIELDKNLARCFTLMNKERQDTREGCPTLVREAYKTCMQFCPVPR